VINNYQGGNLFMGYSNSSPSKIKSRVVAEAYYIIENEATIRATASAFGVSKSTVHRDIREYLENIDTILFGKVIDIISLNKAERHIRGGQATKLMCQRKRL
jgi:putative DeoR family transcriptional regulator (stage III sporulation protein D)